MMLHTLVLEVVASTVELLPDATEYMDSVKCPEIDLLHNIELSKAVAHILIAT